MQFAYTDAQLATSENTGEPLVARLDHLWPPHSGILGLGDHLQQQKFPQMVCMADQLQQETIC